MTGVQTCALPISMKQESVEEVKLICMHSGIHDNSKLNLLVRRTAPATGMSMMEKPLFSLDDDDDNQYFF